MRFCPECGKMLFPKKNMLECECGFSEYISDDECEEEYNFEEEIKNKMTVIFTDNNNVALPTKKITCYKCGGTKGYWWTVQTRSADEAPTYFIRCANCGNTWRRSN
ncbi:transcription factor S [uncultured Methanobrevibacter sp.]|uniref:transcription factor S n=1 Tax=uncultured Methanobrevibacter sp. TaxID=253161 RepID=UPI00262299D8